MNKRPAGLQFKYDQESLVFCPSAEGSSPLLVSTMTKSKEDRRHYLSVEQTESLLALLVDTLRWHKLKEEDKNDEQIEEDASDETR